MSLFSWCNCYTDLYDKNQHCNISNKMFSWIDDCQFSIKHLLMTDGECMYVGAETNYDCTYKQYVKGSVYLKFIFKDISELINLFT